MQNSQKKFIGAAIQMNCILGDVQSNLEKAYQLIQKAAVQGASFIVLPELFNTGYRLDPNDQQYAETIPGYTTDWLIDVAQQFQVIIAGCLLERDGAEIYDTCVIVSSNGVEGTYRKIYLWDQEKDRFSAGEEYKVIHLNDVRVGMQICYEVGFPEGGRLLALKGANVLLYSSAFGKSRRYAWDVATRARALENGCFVIAANRTGIEKDETFFGGGSRIINPKGSVLVEATEEDDVILAEINLRESEEQRKEIPYLRDLHEVYKKESHK